MPRRSKRIKLQQRARVAGRRDLAMSDSGRPNSPRFTLEAQNYLREKGCIHLEEVSKDPAHRGYPIFVLNNPSTKFEVQKRLHALYPQMYGSKIVKWVPCNNVLPLTSTQESRFLTSQVTDRYTTSRMTEPCCSCRKRDGDKCSMDDSDSCSCSTFQEECWHEWRCHMTLIRYGVYPATFLAHTGIRNLGLGVKAGQNIKRGTIIIPFIGKAVARGSASSSLNAFDLTGHQCLKRGAKVQVDPVPFGGHAQFINCIGANHEEPNCGFETYKVGNTITVVIMAKKDIFENDWLTLDYGERYPWADTVRMNQPTGLLPGMKPFNQEMKNPMPSSNCMKWRRPRRP